MSDDVLAEQVAYYRRRAGEYDATAYGDLDEARRRIARIVADLEPRGRVLEIACGTGLWTQPLAESADTVTAIDAAPEPLAVARTQVSAPNVRFEVADIFAWPHCEQFDVIFFSAWLSHVPAERFDEFWTLLDGLLAAGGRVLFNDEHVDERAKERYVDEGIVERTLTDGSTFRIVKHFVDPPRLVDELRRLGWAATVRRDGPDWVLGDVRRA